MRIPQILPESFRFTLLPLLHGRLHGRRLRAGSPRSRSLDEDLVHFAGLSLGSALEAPGSQISEDLGRELSAERLAVSAERLAVSADSRGEGSILQQFPDPLYFFPSKLATLSTDFGPCLRNAAIRPFHVVRIHIVRIPGGENRELPSVRGECHPSKIYTSKIEIGSGRTRKFLDSYYCVYWATARTSYGQIEEMLGSSG